MNKIRLLGFVTLLVSIVLLALSVINGESEIILLFVIPIVISHGPIGALGILLLFASIVLLFLSATITEPREQYPQQENEFRGPSQPESETRKSKFGGVIFIGPIPIVFGSGKELLRNKWFLISIVAIALVFLAITIILLLLSL